MDTDDDFDSIEDAHQVLRQIQQGVEMLPAEDQVQVEQACKDIAAAIAKHGDFGFVALVIQHCKELIARNIDNVGDDTLRVVN